MEMNAPRCLVQVLCALIVEHAAAQQCALITNSEITQRIEDSSILENATSLDIVDINFNCQAVGANFGRYRFATVTANVTYSSPQTGNVVLQVDLACTSDGGQSEWSNSIETRIVTNETEIELLLNANTRTSCSSCNPTDGDTLYHCQGNIQMCIYSYTEDLKIFAGINFRSKILSTTDKFFVFNFRR